MSIINEVLYKSITKKTLLSIREVHSLKSRIVYRKSLTARLNEMKGSFSSAQRSSVTHVGSTLFCHYALHTENVERIHIHGRNKSYALQKKPSLISASANLK